MKRQEIAQKLDEMVKDMPGTFYVHNDGDLNLEWDGSKIASFKDWNHKEVVFDLSKKFSSAEQETITAFVERAVVLIGKARERYTIQVVAGQKEGYLNLNTVNNTILISDNDDFSCYKARFTKSEIERLKKREGIYIDWDRVIINKVESEEF